MLSQELKKQNLQSGIMPVYYYYYYYYYYYQVILIISISERGPFLGPLGLIKKCRGVGRRRDRVDIVSIYSTHIFVISILRSSFFEIFSMTFVQVFRSDGTDTSITLQHHLAWSLITILGLFIDNSLSVCICISASKG